MILPAKWATECPEECRCDTHSYPAYMVNCSGSSLNSIPSMVPKHLHILVFDGNKITYFENDNFVSIGLVELLVIQADFSKIRKLELGAFKGLTNLTNLSIQGNEISEIIARTSQNCSHMKDIDLRNMRIEQLERDIFCGLLKLEYINMEGNNLRYIHPVVFSGLPILESLHLSKICGFQTRTDRHFINSHSLTSLFASYCNVSSVSVETFAKVSALEWLHLSYNNLRR